MRDGGTDSEGRTFSNPLVVLLIPRSDRHAELLEELDEREALGLREPARCRIHQAFVTREELDRLFFACFRQPNDASSFCQWVGLAGDEAQRTGVDPRPW